MSPGKNFSRRLVVSHFAFFSSTPVIPSLPASRHNRPDYCSTHIFYSVPLNFTGDKSDKIR